MFFFCFFVPGGFGSFGFLVCGVVSDVCFWDLRAIYGCRVSCLCFMETSGRERGV